MSIGNETWLWGDEYIRNLSFDNRAGIPWEEIGKVPVTTGFDDQIETLIGKCDVLIKGKVDSYDALRWRGSHDIKRGPAGQFVIINLHPEFDHGRKELEEGLMKHAHEIASELTPICGGATTKTTTPTPTPPVENAREVEALAKTTPSEKDLPLSLVEKKSTSIRIARLDGLADFQLPDGTWIQIQEGDTLPSAGTLQTQYGSTAELHFADGIVLFIGALTELNIKEFYLDPQSYRTKLDLGTGEVRVKVLEGDFETDMKVSTPNWTGSPVGTDFAVSYDKNSGSSVYEIYDGSLIVTKETDDQTKTISSSYGSPIHRVEVSRDGALTEQIAIPKEEWQTRQKLQTESQNVPQKNLGRKLLWIFLLVIGGGIFWFYKIGGFAFLKEKISGSKKI